MRKKLIRMLAVIVLVVVIVLIGYLSFTGDRLSNPPPSLDCYKGYTFKSDSGGTIAFTDENVWYATGNSPMYLMEIKGYKEGIISMQRKDVFYKFVAIDETMIYDCQSKEFLVRSGDG